MFINISIKSKNKNSLKNFLKFFKKITTIKKLHITRILRMSQRPRRVKVFTILKSPHVNKIAQEQFEFNIFSKHIKIKTVHVLKILKILKKLQNSLFADISIKINFNINSTTNLPLLIETFQPQKVRLLEKNLKNYEQIKLYLVLFNFYGKYKFFLKV